MTDSIGCLNHQLVQEYDIGIVPINFFAGGKIYRDWVDVTPSQAYELFLQDPDSFNTSAASPEDCLQAYRKAAQDANEILFITVSKKLSRVYDSAIAAAELARADMPGINIRIIDSTQATSSEGMIALAAAQAAKDGKDLRETARAAEAVLEKVGAIVYLDTIKHVYRSGRIPKIASQVGGMLNIKPILTINEIVHFAGMARSRKKGIDKMLEMMREKVGDKPIHFAVTHAYAPQDANFGEIGRLFGMKTAGCSGKSATSLAAPD